MTERGPVRMTTGGNEGLTTDFPDDTDKWQQRRGWIWQLALTVVTTEGR